MGELLLARSPGDRRRYDLAGVGSIRRMGLFSRTALLLPADGEPLTARSRVGLGGEAEAVSAGGDVVGSYGGPDLLTRSGEITWRDRALHLRTTPLLVSRFALREGRTTLLDLQATGWGPSPARVSVHETITSGPDPGLDPGLVLFALWLAQGFVDHDSGRGPAGADAAIL